MVVSLARRLRSMTTGVFFCTVSAFRCIGESISAANKWYERLLDSRAQISIYALVSVYIVRVFSQNISSVSPLEEEHGHNRDVC